MTTMTDDELAEYRQVVAKSRASLAVLPDDNPFKPVLLAMAARLDENDERLGLAGE